MPYLELSERNHYQVLGLRCKSPEYTTFAAQDIRQAYKRALLQSHPDKLHTSTPASSGRRKECYSIDDITHSYKVLSTPKLRAEHDRQLRLQAQHSRLSDVRRSGWPTTTCNELGKHKVEADNLGRCGLEAIDLDELTYDSREEIWYKPCSCGLDRGFVVREEDLEKGLEEDVNRGISRRDGRGEVMVGCRGCSLWVVVAFGVLGGEEEQEQQYDDHKDEKVV